MSSELLKWVASALVAAVLASTLWIAHAAHPEQGGASLMYAQAAAPGQAASAPATATR